MQNSRMLVRTQERMLFGSGSGSVWLVPECLAFVDRQAWQCFDSGEGEILKAEGRSLGM